MSYGARYGIQKSERISDIYADIEKSKPAHDAFVAHFTGCAACNPSKNRYCVAGVRILKEYSPEMAEKAILSRHF